MNYKEYPIQPAPSAERSIGGCRIRIGEPFVIAAKDDSPDEGHFVTPAYGNQS